MLVLPSHYPGATCLSSPVTICGVTMTTIVGLATLSMFGGTSRSAPQFAIVEQSTHLRLTSSRIATARPIQLNTVAPQGGGSRGVHVGLEGPHNQVAPHVAICIPLSIYYTHNCQANAGTAEP